MQDNIYLAENKRVKIVLDFLKKSKKIRNHQQFIEEIGSNKSIISRIINKKLKVSNNLFYKIKEKYPELSLNWLLTGDGEMLESTIDNDTSLQEAEDVTMVRLFPAAAMGGSFNDFVVSVKDTDECEMVVSPVRNVDGALTVLGESMAPEYPNGSRIFVKRINEQAFIEWGKVYVLDTCNGAVIKQVVQSDKEGYVRCVSLNPDPIYQPFDVRWEDIYHWFKVVCCLSLK